MTRIPLTDEDIEIGYVDEIDGFSSEHYKDWKGKNLIINECENPEQLKKQILDDSEKAEKYDELARAYKKVTDDDRIIQKEYRDIIKKLEQENKQLQKTVNALHFDIKLNLRMIESREKIVQKLRERFKIAEEDAIRAGNDPVCSAVADELKEILGDGK